MQIYANSTNTPMDTCMSSIVKNSFKGIDTVQQVQSYSDISRVVDNLIKVFFIYRGRVGLAGCGPP